MRSVEEQLGMVVDAAVTPEPIRLGLGEALGLMCAEEISAARPLPGFNQAAVDGYAVRSVDVGGTAAIAARQSGQETQDGEDAAETPRPAGERALPVVGEVHALSLIHI